MKFECTAVKNCCGFQKPVKGRKVCDVAHCSDYKKNKESCRLCQYRYQPASKKPEPAQIKVNPISRFNYDKYLKLWNGDIYNVESGTILDRQALLKIIG